MLHSNQGRFGGDITWLSVRPLYVASFFSILILAAATARAQQQTVPVGTVYAQRQQIAQARDFVGRVEATDGSRFAPG